MPVSINGSGSIDGVTIIDNPLLKLDTSNGRVGIQTATPVTELHVNGTITETSSLRFKKNINPIINALDLICQINGVTYDRQDDSNTNEPGFIAEYINEILPNVVSKDDDGEACGVNYTRIVAYLVEAIKELRQEIDELKNGRS